jgi:hypothetical protein
MRGARICIIGITLLVLMSVSAVNCQNGTSKNVTDKDVSDQKLIDDLNNMRLRLLTILDATIPVKDNFDKAGSTLNSVNKAAGKINTYKDKNGRILAEMMDSRNVLLNDTFEDPATNIVLNTDYVIYKEPLCYNLTDTMNMEQLKVCYRCNETRVWQNHTIWQSGVWMNQTVWDLKTGNVLIVKLNCCGNTTESALSYKSGLPGNVTYCFNTHQFEVS